MTVYSKAPMRIGLAGGGTDVSPYCDLYGGAVLNATISLYAHAKLEITGGQIIIESTDRQERAIFEISNNLPINGQLDLQSCLQSFAKRFPFAPDRIQLIYRYRCARWFGLGHLLYPGGCYPWRIFKPL